jgi:hypothetical protein
MHAAVAGAAEHGAVWAGEDVAPLVLAQWSGQGFSSVASCWWSRVANKVALQSANLLM